MIKVGLSGNRYSGKSRVSNLFTQIGIPVFDADTILRFILNYNWELLADIKQQLGSDIFQGDFLNFREIKDTTTFNSILDMIEPDILKAYERFNAKQNSIYTIFHSSILFERGLNRKMDKNITIFASHTDRISRCKELTKMGLLPINNLSKTEMDPLDKNQLADFTIHNYNDETSIFGNTFTQVCKVDQKLIDMFLYNEQTKKVLV